MKSVLIILSLALLNSASSYSFMTKKAKFRIFTSNYMIDSIKNLSELSRKELQQLAKENGVKANLKSEDIIQSLESIKKSNPSVNTSEKLTLRNTNLKPSIKNEENDIQSIMSEQGITLEDLDVLQNSVLGNVKPPAKKRKETSKDGKIVSDKKKSTKDKVEKPKDRKSNSETKPVPTEAKKSKIRDKVTAKTTITATTTTTKLKPPVVIKSKPPVAIKSKPPVAAKPKNNDWSPGRMIASPMMDFAVTNIQSDYSMKAPKNAKTKESINLDGVTLKVDFEIIHLV